MALDIYIRVLETGNRTAEESTEAYEVKCRAWAERESIEVGEVAEDTDVSGRHGARVLGTASTHQLRADLPAS